MTAQDYTVIAACAILALGILYWVQESMKAGTDRRYRIDFSDGPPLRDLTWSEATHCQEYFGGIITAEKREPL